MKICLSIVITILLLTTLPAKGDVERIEFGGVDGIDPFDTTRQYPVLLALSGGGARGIASIGILKAFEERHIVPTAIAGTSMGGIIGGLYAAGYSADQMISLVNHIDFDGLFSNSPSRKYMFLTQREEMGRHFFSIRFDGLHPVIPKALSAGQKLTNILTRYTIPANYRCGGDFSKLPIPFKTICTDIITGKEVIHEKGSLADAMRGTMGFPLAFTPLTDGDQLLMDGGMVTPIPVELVQEMDPTTSYTVAINTSSPLKPKEKLVTPVDIANQVTSIMTADKLEAQLAKADIVLTPSIDTVESTDFYLKNELIDVGYKTGIRAADSIIKCLDSEQKNVTYAILRVKLIDIPETVRTEFINRLEGQTMSRTEMLTTIRDIVAAFYLFKTDVAIHTDAREYGLIKDVILEISASETQPVNDLRFLFTNNRVYPDDTLLNLMRSENVMFTFHALRDGLKRITEHYHKAGYDLAYIKNVKLDLARGIVEITVDEAIITEINVKNNDRSRDWFITSRYPQNVGKPYSSRKAIQGINNIYGTDLFDRVTTELTPTDSGVAVTIGLEEKKHTQLRLGWHWDDDYDSEEFLEVLDGNVAGIGLEYLTHLQYGEKRQHYFTGFKMDRIWSTYLTFRAQIYHHRLNRSVYNSDGSYDFTRKEIKTGVKAKLGQQISRLGTLSAEVLAERIKYRNVKTTVTEEFDLRSLRLESYVETFDRYPFPESGKKHFFEIQFAGKYLGGDVEFTRFYTSIEGYFPINEYINFHPWFRLGTSRSGLPPSEQFYLGGTHSLAGFPSNRFSGDKLFILSNELRLKFPLNVYLSIRHDMGDVYTGTDQIKIKSMHHGLAYILAVDTPLGPLELGYGNADATAIDEFYINIGLAF